MKPYSFLCKKDSDNYFYKGNVYLISFNDAKDPEYPYFCEKDEKGNEHKMDKKFLDEYFQYVKDVVIPKPYCNPYSLAKKAYDDIQITQIQKGMQKYGTPLHPSNHSSEELFNHAFEELVDLTHYIATYHYKMHHIKERLAKGLATGDPDRLAEAVQEALDMIGDTV